MLSAMSYHGASPLTNLLAIPMSHSGDKDYLPGDDIANYKIVIGNQDANTTLHMDWIFFSKGLKNYPKCESLLIGAVRNFIRKTNFAELNEALQEEDISEEEYNREIDENSDKYAVTLKNIETPEDVLLITQLINKIGFDLREFTTSEVSEMFSVKEDQLVSNIIYFRDQLK